MNWNLSEIIRSLPLFHPEWILWILLLLSLVTIGLAIERQLFFRKRKINLGLIERMVSERLQARDPAGARAFLDSYDSLETHVLAAGLQGCDLGPEAVDDLMRAALARQRKRYEQGLSWLGTIGSNAPFIGLFGTVLGIMRAFMDLSTNMGNASQAVMAGISEALVATAVGLFVAIPAIIAHNTFRSRLRALIGDADILARTLLAYLKSEPIASGARCNELGGS